MPTQGRYLECADPYRWDQRAATLPVDNVSVRRAAEGFALDFLIYTHSACNGAQAGDQTDPSEPGSGMAGMPSS